MYYVGFLRHSVAQRTILNAGYEFSIGQGYLCSHTVDKYNSSTPSNLKTIDILDTMFCKCVDYKLDHHIGDIDAYYSSIRDALIVASKAHIPSCNFRCSQDYIVSEFNEHLKDLHDTSRQYYLVCRDTGRSRNDETHSDMRRSRLQFKYMLLDSVVQMKTW